MVDESKVRLRSDQELDDQNLGLIEIKKILNDLDIPYLLSSGTLLGAVREKDFIRWDWDVQMYLFMESAYSQRCNILNALRQRQFEITNFINSDDSLKFDLLKRGAKYELTAWSRTGEWRHRKKRKLKVPAYLFDKTSEIEFRGEIYTTFQSPEKYLEFCYGDWRVPIRTAIKSEYATKQHLALSVRETLLLLVPGNLKTYLISIRHFFSRLRNR